ncbi:hypothetical protein GUJ93_ZPchr0001g29252 [Zizania palustris]|uniref:Uncharacterized protein n=1 Tax=Zizania palustris TaxID=103762 RepID=A0A8J5V0L8_ZIZPA|nr:hypothetical protein GUJ93_ZPchr0001g29252 [Zizania palustris]
MPLSFRRTASPRHRATAPSSPSVMPPLRRSPRLMELNKKKEANVNANQITESRSIPTHDSNGRKQKGKHPIGQIGEAKFQRTPPMLPNQQSSMEINRHRSRTCSGKKVDFFGHQQPAQYQCNQLPASNVQLPLPTYQSSQISTTNTSNASSSQLPSILGKRPAESESFFPLDGSLVQSVGPPEFLATSESERVPASGGSLDEPTRAAAAAAAPSHFPVMSSNAVPEPSSILGIKDGNGDGDGDGKGKDVWSYWKSPAVARIMKRIRTRETTTQKTLGLDGHGQGSSKSTMQRRP